MSRDSPPVSPVRPVPRASSSWLSSWSKLEVTRPNLARTLHLAKHVAGTVGDDDVDPQLEAAVDLVVVAYLQVPPEDRRRAVRNAVGMLRPGGTFLLVAHDSTNLTDGTGGPQDPAVLMTAQDVVDDLTGAPDLDVEVLRAERVAREVTAADGHGGEERRTAWDCLVRVVRR